MLPQDADGPNISASLAFQPVRGEPGRCMAGAVEAVELLVPGALMEHETVAADAGAERFYDAQQGRSGYGRIGGIAAIAQDIEGGRGGR